MKIYLKAFVLLFVLGTGGFVLQSFNLSETKMEVSTDSNEEDEVLVSYCKYELNNVVKNINAPRPWLFNGSIICLPCQGAGGPPGGPINATCLAPANQGSIRIDDGGVIVGAATITLRNLVCRPCANGTVTPNVSFPQN